MATVRGGIITAGVCTALFAGAAIYNKITSAEPTRAPTHYARDSLDEDIARKAEEKKRLEEARKKEEQQTTPTSAVTPSTTPIIEITSPPAMQKVFTTAQSTSPAEQSKHQHQEQEDFSALHAKIAKTREEQRKQDELNARLAELSRNQEMLRKVQLAQAQQAKRQLEQLVEETLKATGTQSTPLQSEQAQAVRAGTVQSTVAQSVTQERTPEKGYAEESKQLYEIRREDGRIKLVYAGTEKEVTKEDRKTLAKPLLLEHLVNRGMPAIRSIADKEQRLQKLEELYQKTVRLYPKTVSTFNQGQTEEPTKPLQEIVQEQGKIAYELCKTYIKLGQREKAQEIFNENKTALTESQQKSLQNAYTRQFYPEQSKGNPANLPIIGLLYSHEQGKRHPLAIASRVADIPDAIIGKPLAKTAENSEGAHLGNVLHNLFRSVDDLLIVGDNGNELIREIGRKGLVQAVKDNKGQTFYTLTKTGAAIYGGLIMSSGSSAAAPAKLGGGQTSTSGIQ